MGLEKNIADIPTEEEKRILIYQVMRSTAGEERKRELMDEVNMIMNYKQYEAMGYYLESIQPTIHDMPYYSETDITRHLKRFIF